MHGVSLNIAVNCNESLFGYLLFQNNVFQPLSLPDGIIQFYLPSIDEHLRIPFYFSVGTAL